MSLKALREFLVLLTSWLAAAQTVTDEGGNLVFIDGDGSRRAITESGRDSQPSLSADGRQVVFVRALREVPGIGVPNVMVTEIWVAGTRAPGRRRVYARPVTMPDGRSSQAFAAPKFSPDTRHIYFLADYSATSAALCRLDLATGTSQFLSPAHEYDVLQSGPHKGFLVASIRSLSAPDADGNRFAIYPYYLLDPDGKREARVANEDEKLEDVARRCLR
jgi:Tol biopolymer transport system component